MFLCGHQFHPLSGSHGKSVMRRLGACCTVWNLVPGLYPPSPSLYPFLSVLSSPISGLCGDGKRNEDFTRTWKKGSNTPRESAVQSPADEGKRGPGQEMVYSLFSQFLPYGKPMDTPFLFWKRNDLSQVTHPENSGTGVKTVKAGLLRLDERIRLSLLLC